MYTKQKRFAIKLRCSDPLMCYCKRTNCRSFAVFAIDRKPRKIIPAKLILIILTLFNAQHFLETAKIDTREYVHLTESAKKLATAKINTFTVFMHTT